jgi:hypothetical protein
MASQTGNFFWIRGLKASRGVSDSTRCAENHGFKVKTSLATAQPSTLRRTGSAPNFVLRRVGVTAIRGAKGLVVVSRTGPSVHRYWSIPCQ